MQEEFVEPTKKLLHALCGRDTLPDYDFASVAERKSPAVRSKRKRAALSQASPSEHPQRVCYNKAKKKRCFSAPAMPTFSTMQQAACDQCRQLYGGTGKFTPKRAKLLRETP